MEQSTKQGAAAPDAALQSEDSLIAGLKRGDRAAAETLVRRHGAWMLAVARRVLGEPALAEDCVQEAFVKAFSKIAGFEGRASLKSWLHRIVVNQALMKLRARRARGEAPIDELLPAFDENACRIEARWQHIATPEEILDSKHRRDLVRAKIDELPESYRLVLQLRDIEDLSTREVADGLGLSEANVKVRLHRARSALKKLLEPLLKGDA